ncbi:signal peptidase complex subunit 2-like [Littorina saxatilis]|uniref:Signal peptidase complex subunit 2 n=1 Tax=Littorina saxatilis TaxID=31220 RepID=A0AAN9G1V3_9CAEN
MASEKSKNQLAGDDKPIKINKWDNAALKNGLDDAAKNVLTKNYGFVENHSLMDGRLVICTIAVAFAMFALVLDFFRPFPESRPVLIVCVTAYFVLMGVLTFYTTYKERGIFLVALEKDRAGMDPDNTWTLSSSLRKYDDMYELCMTYSDGKTGETRKAELCKSVANFFDENGVLCADLFNPEIEKMKESLTSEKKLN